MVWVTKIITPWFPEIPTLLWLVWELRFVVPVTVILSQRVLCAAAAAPDRLAVLALRGAHLPAMVEVTEAKALTAPHTLAVVVRVDILVLAGAGRMAVLMAVRRLLAAVEAAAQGVMVAAVLASLGKARVALGAPILVDLGVAVVAPTVKVGAVLQSAGCMAVAEALAPMAVTVRSVLSGPATPAHSLLPA